MWLLEHQIGRPNLLHALAGQSIDRRQVMKTMASKGRKLITGDTGARLMAELIPSSSHMGDR